jgi:hypothetical protein
MDTLAVLCSRAGNYNRKSWSVFIRPAALNPSTITAPDQLQPSSHRNHIAPATLNRTVSSTMRVRSQLLEAA